MLGETNHTVPALPAIDSWLFNLQKRNTGWIFLFLY